MMPRYANTQAIGPARDTGREQACVGPGASRVARENLGFPAESRETLGVVRNDGEEDLDRDVPIEFGVTRPIDGAHAADTEDGDDFVWTEARADVERHLRAEL